jgi:asparagine synthase (glutamine-hydrolysing)
MAHGLETRAPLLFRPFAELALALSNDNRGTSSGGLKWRLRRLVRQRYGERIASAKKQGFSIPIHRWLRGPGRKLVDNLLDPSAVNATGLLNAYEVSRAVKAHQSGRSQLGFELWGLMVLVAWHQMRVATRPPTRRDGLRRVVLPQVAGVAR